MSDIPILFAVKPDSGGFRLEWVGTEPTINIKGAHGLKLTFEDACHLRDILRVALDGIEPIVRGF